MTLSKMTLNMKIKKFTLSITSICKMI